MTARPPGHTDRTGRYITQPAGYEAFVPAAPPYKPPLQIDDDLLTLLSNADRYIGRLDAASDMLPNPDLFVGMYVTKEAVLSSQIEGVTQASLGEVLEHQAKANVGQLPDIAEVMNYVAAMNYGLERLGELPLSNRLLREIHERLLRGVRGGEMLPGQFRTTQNWIGPPGSTIETASFVPPPPTEMNDAINALEYYMHDTTRAPLLIKAGLIHSQFETIHPFLDGNGRMGRLLVVFYLCQQGILKKPLLYLSAFFNEFKDEYYARLQAVRDSGDVEGWMRFFLTGLWRVAEAAARTAHEILTMRENHRQAIQESLAGAVNGLELLDTLLRFPFITVNEAASKLEVSYPTANNLVTSLVTLRILEEVTGQERNRRFRYTPYLNLMDTAVEIKP